MKSIYHFAALLLVTFLSSCATILQDEVAVKRTLGKLNDHVYPSGVRFFNPFLSKMIRVPLEVYPPLQILKLLSLMEKLP